MINTIIKKVGAFLWKNIWVVCLVISLCSIVLLLELNTKQRALIKQQNDLIQKQQGIIEDVLKTEQEMQKVRPKTTWREASIFVGKCRAFGLPLKVALISARAETEFRMNARGPCGEWGTHQAMYWTMRSYFPLADATKLIYWEVASWLHLKECYERSGHKLFLTLAYHNAGPNWSRPERAMWAARKHISRCRVIRKEIDIDFLREESDLQCYIGVGRSA